MTSPILGLFGGADEAIGPDGRAAFERALTAARVPHELVTYPDAPHSFFDRKAADFAEAWPTPGVGPSTSSGRPPA